MVGEFPGLAVLDEDDNLRNTSDFRGVYCALLEQWLGRGRRPDHPERLLVRPPGAGGVMRPRQLVLVALLAVAASRHGRPPRPSAASTGSGRRSTVQLRPGIAGRGWST